MIFFTIQSQVFPVVGQYNSLTLSDSLQYRPTGMFIPVGTLLAEVLCSWVSYDVITAALNPSVVTNKAAYTRLEKMEILDSHKPTISY